MADRTTGELAAVQESPIGGLPGIMDLYRDSLIPVEQQGEARKMTGGQFADYARESVREYVQQAEDSADKASEQVALAAQQVDRAAVQVLLAEKQAEAASSNATKAQYSAEQAQTARKSIEDMSVSAETLPPDSTATAVKTAVGGSINIRFGIPQGPQGETGPAGQQGIQGPPGKDGINGISVPSNGKWAFNVDENGHLILGYTEDEAPDFSINEDGHLILNIT